MKQTFKYVLIALCSLTLAVGCIKETFPNTNYDTIDQAQNLRLPTLLPTLHVMHC